MPHAAVKGNINIEKQDMGKEITILIPFWQPDCDQHVCCGGDGRGEGQLFTYTSISVNSEQSLENNTESDIGIKALSVGGTLV